HAPEPPKPDEGPEGFLYGRITTVDGATHEGRLRFGGDQEAFWGDYFNGQKKGNPWLAQIPPEKAPKEHSKLEVFGLKVAERDTSIKVERRFMVPLGDIARIESGGSRDVRVTLKSGSVFDLNRWDSSDFDDGVRIWEAGGSVVDLDTARLKTIDFLPAPASL